MSQSARAAGAPTARAATNGAAEPAELRRVAAPVARPQQDREQRVEDHRAGCAADRAGRPGQHPAQPFTEPPHAQGPDDRGPQREPDRGPPGDAEAQQELDGGEGRVERDRVLPHETGVPEDGRRRRLGCPGAAAASIWLKARVNMTGWYCRIASSSHRAPRASCSRRRASGAGRLRAGRLRAAVGAVRGPRGGGTRPGRAEPQRARARAVRSLPPGRGKLAGQSSHPQPPRRRTPQRRKTRKSCWRRAGRRLLTLLALPRAGPRRDVSWTH